MKSLIILFFLALANAHWWQGSDACGYVIGGSHGHVPRDVRELDCSSYMQTTVTPSYVAGVVTITTVVLDEITYTEASTNIVYVTARDVKPRNVVIVTVTGDYITLTATEDAIKTTTTETIPIYATSACPNHSAYVEACRSHLSVVVATITVTAPTSYATEYTTVNLPGDLSGSSVFGTISNIVETITSTSIVVGETTSSSSSSLSLVVEPTSTNVTVSSLSSSSSASEILSVQSSETSTILSSILSTSLSSNIYLSTSSSILGSSIISSSSSSVSLGPTLSPVLPTSTTSLSQNTLATFASLGFGSEVLSASFSTSLTSATETSLPSSQSSTSGTLTISPSSSRLSVSSTKPASSIITDLSVTSSSSVSEVSSTLSSTLSSQSSSSSSTFSTAIPLATSSRLAPEILPSPTPSSSFSSSTFSTLISSSTTTFQSSTNSSSASTFLPISSSLPILKSPVSPLVATCNATAACRQNQHCSPDNSCLCQPSVGGTGYCMADIPCAALTSCTIDSDCGIGSTCMQTCCSTNKCLSLQGLCQNPRTALVIFKREDEGTSGYRMVGEVGDEEGGWTNRGPWFKRLRKI